MPIPLSDAVKQAAVAAQAIHADCVRVRAASTLTVPEVVRFANGLQARFDAVKPLLAYQPAEVQAAASDKFGSLAPANVLLLLGEAQALGLSLVAAIVGQVYPPASAAAHAWDDDAGLYRDRALAGSDLTPMHAPLDALIAKLEPLA